MGSRGHKEEGTSIAATARGRRRSSGRRIGERVAVCRALSIAVPFVMYSFFPIQTIQRTRLNAAIRQLLWKEGSILCRFDKDWFRLYLQVQPYMCKHKTRTEFLSSRSIHLELSELYRHLAILHIIFF